MRPFAWSGRTLSAVAGSMGRRNTIYDNVDLRGGVYGTNGAPGFAPEQMAELWKRWKAGQSMNGIGRALGRDRSSIHTWCAATGGLFRRPVGARDWHSR